VRNQIQVISGLTDISAEPGADGAGDHARAGGTFLTGVRIKKTAGSDIKAGVSIDQVVANQIGHQTRFASLELTCDVVRKSGECDSGYACAYEYNLAWQSSNQPLAPEHNPQFAFERCSVTGARNERVANLKRREYEQHSILDYVMDDAKALNTRARRPRPAEARPVPDQRARDRTAHRDRQVHAVPNPDIDAPAGVPRATRSTSR
jgi:hypothetical protein